MPLHSSQKMDKKAHRKQKPRKMTYYPPNAGQFTEMPICMGLILSQDLGVQRNMVWEICGGIFTLQIADMAEMHGIKKTDWRSPGNTYPVRIGLK